MRNVTHFMSLLEFARHLGLYKCEEILEEGFEVYFQGGLRDEAYFGAEEYWTRFMMKLARKLRLLTDDVLDGLRSPIICRTLDATTLWELIGLDRRLIADNPASEISRFAMP
ncbi:hypothetical protein Tco_0601598 [Tanacetum coccineum]